MLFYVEDTRAKSDAIVFLFLLGTSFNDACNLQMIQNESNIGILMKLENNFAKYEIMINVSGTFQKCHKKFHIFFFSKLYFSPILFCITLNLTTLNKRLKYYVFSGNGFTKQANNETIISSLPFGLKTIIFLVKLLFRCFLVL